MTSATYPADGAAPLGALPRLSQRFAAELIAAAQVLAVGVAAAVLMTAAHWNQPKPAPAEPAYRSAYEGPISLTASTAEPQDSRRLLQDLLVKAGLRPNYELRHLSLDQARRVNALMPAEALPQTAKPFVLPTNTKDGREALNCLTQAAYFEAGAAGPAAEAGVVQVVLNRVRHPDFPKSVCGVVYQGARHQVGCQFTFACDGALKRTLDAASWNQAHQVAARALSGYVVPAVGSATYYHADYVVPVWAPSLIKLATIGPHIFYRMNGPLGEAAALTGRYAGGELKAVHVIDLKPAAAAPPERVHLQMASVEAPAKTETAQPAPAVAAPAPVASVDAAPAA